MSDTNIEWTDAVWNPVTGCTKVSAGCKFCYAEAVANRFWGEQYADSTWGTARKFTDVRCHEDRLSQPLAWRKPRRVFVNSMSDLFHPDVPAAFIARVFDVVRACQAAERGHVFQVLTKRPARMRDLMPRLRFDGTANYGEGRTWFADTPDAGGYPLAAGHRGATGLTNLWLGVSVEDQATADARIPLLLQTPAAVRFVSAEPLLGPVDLDRGGFTLLEPVTSPSGKRWPGLNWVIVGGESGPLARPCDMAWIRSIVQQCQGAGVPCFIKQLGARPRGVCSWPHHDEIPPKWLDEDGCIRSVSRRPRSDEFDLCHAVDDAWWPCAPKLKSRKGNNPAEWPTDLRVREFPHA